MCSEGMRAGEFRQDDTMLVYPQEKRRCSRKNSSKSESCKRSIILRERKTGLIFERVRAALLRSFREEHCKKILVRIEPRVS